MVGAGSPRCLAAGYTENSGKVGRVLHERIGQPLVALAVVDGGAAYSTPPAIHANRN